MYEINQQLDRVERRQSPSTLASEALLREVQQIREQERPLPEQQQQEQGQPKQQVQEQEQEQWAQPSQEQQQEQDRQQQPREPQQVTDINGRRCRENPQPGQVPILRSGVSSQGCTFGDGAAGPGNDPTEMPPFNTQELYRQALRENVRITEGRSGRTEPAGSGVVIGRHADQCIVATAAHVTEGSGNIGVTMPNGRNYQAELRINEPHRDRAALAVRTGADTEAVCRPATIAERSGERGPGWTTGFPEASRSMYVSPTQINGLDRSRAWRVPAAVDTTAHTMPGNSGGPIYNQRGEVIGLVIAGPTPADLPRGSHLTVSIGVPFNRQLQQEWMTRIQNQRPAR